MVSVRLHMGLDDVYYGQGCQNLSYSDVFDDTAPVVRKQWYFRKNKSHLKAQSLG